MTMYISEPLTKEEYWLNSQLILSWLLTVNNYYYCWYPVLKCSLKTKECVLKGIILVFRILVKKRGETQNVGFGDGSYSQEKGKCCLKNQHPVQNSYTQLKKPFILTFPWHCCEGIETVPFPIQHLPYFLVLRKLLLVVGICVGGRVSYGSLFNLLYHLILWLNNQNLRHQDHIQIHFQDKGGPRRGICMFPVCISNNMVVCTLRSRPGPSCSKGG